MGVSLNWLKKYVDIPWSAEELAHELTMAGIAIEGIENIGGDSILELDLTPNRGDCQGLINLAREVAALTGNRLKIPDVNLKEGQEKTQDYIRVEISAPDLCKRYAARVVKGVKVQPSPDWMQEALLNSGIRPINNVVDVTNYVMLETNQPLHAFDYELLAAGKEIVVRRAGDKEKFTTLDGVERELNQDMMVITDGAQAVALAGIMGGENTEINDNTTTVLLESANFLGSNIRRTSRKLGLRSDSSVRFEKGADVNGLIYALNRAAQLIQALAGGEVLQGVVDVYPQTVERKKVTLRPERVNYLLGTDISALEIKSYLDKLQFDFREIEGLLVVDIPTYRPDIEMEVDLIEEVARLYGYDKVPANLPTGDTSQGGLNPYQKFREKIRNIASYSLNEVVNYSFISPAAFDQLLVPENSPLRNVVRIANPLSEEQSVMRTILLPGLLGNVSHNLARKNSNLAFFEIGAAFIPVGFGLPEEKPRLGAVVAGTSEVNWLKYKISMDFFYLKGMLEDILEQVGLGECQFIPQRLPFLHPGRAAKVVYGDQEIGFIGEVHPLVLENFDIKERTCAFELDLQVMFRLSRAKSLTEAITRFPAVERDIAVLLKDKVEAAEALAVIKQAEQNLLREVTVFDVYTGEQVADGYKSMAFRLKLQSGERTLTESDVSNSVEKILNQLKDKLGATLR